MNFLELLYNTLKQFNLPIYLQGSIGADEKYPDHFITYWIPDSTDSSHYNNNVHTVDWYVTVIYYTNDMNTIMSKSAEILSALRAVGFIPQGKGNFIPSDEATHTGWTMDLIYCETQKL